MAYYLVSARPHDERLDELRRMLEQDAFVEMRPFGATLTHSLRNARHRPDGTVVWEEEDYCRPPLAQERAAVLDRYFTAIEVEPVAEGQGWKKIQTLSPLFPTLADEIVV